PLDKLLEKYSARPEAGPAEPLHRVVARGQLALVAAQAHSDPAATRRALEHHRISDRARRLHRVAGRTQKSRSRQQRHAVRLRDFARSVLQPEQPHLFRCRSDEDYARPPAGFGKLRILAEKSVSRMN